MFSSTTRAAVSPPQLPPALALTPSASAIAPLQGPAATGNSYPTPPIVSRIRLASAAATSTPLASAASPALAADLGILAATPSSISGGVAWRPHATAAPRSHLTTAGGGAGAHNVRSKTLEQEVGSFEGALDQLLVLGEEFYDEIESSACPTSRSLQVEQSLITLLTHLQGLLDEMATSPLGGLVVGPGGNIDGPTDHQEKAKTAGSLEEKVAALKASSNDVYERRMRLREGAGMVAHILAPRGRTAGT